jgi:hypothetical protein
LEWLPQLSNLTHLTLRLSLLKAGDLEPLARLNKLTQLSLSYSEENVLEPLAELNNLKQLSLDINDFQIPYLAPLTKLNNLTQLSLDLTGINATDLTPLAQLSKLTRLSLFASGEQMTNLEPLAQLRSLTQLSLDLGSSNISDLKPLEQLSEEKVEALAEIIRRAGESAAALLVLMATLENAPHPKAVANAAKHFALTRCVELNLYGMVDSQIALLESELLAANLLAARSFS